MKHVHVFVISASGGHRQDLRIGPFSGDCGPFLGPQIMIVCVDRLRAGCSRPGPKFELEFRELCGGVDLLCHGRQPTTLGLPRATPAAVGETLPWSLRRGWFGTSAVMVSRHV